MGGGTPLVQREKGNRECCLEGPQRSATSSPPPEIPVILPEQYKQASNQGGLAANILNPISAS